MLVVSRKQEQSIHVGSDVIVRVVAIKGKRGRLAIEAPREVRILRGELVAEQKGLAPTRVAQAIFTPEQTW